MHKQYGEERRRKMKKILPGILLTILLSGMFFSAFNIQSVKAAGTIYITADGSISPPEAPISSLDNITYTLTGNVTDSIVVERSNIVVDGTGYSVEGDGTGNGVSLQNIVNVTIENTRIEGCIDGIQLFNSANNIITGNSLVGNSYEGIELYYSSYNIITQNSITDNQVGIGLYDSSNNLIFHNSFTNNAIQVYTETSVNVWDNGYPSGGNYWDDYNGVDARCGPNQDYPGGDGMGDSSFTIDSNNKDRYPLMNTWTPPYGHDVTVISAVSYKTVIGQAYGGNITVYTANIGEYTETFNVTIYAKTTPIASTTVLLETGSTTSSTFYWNTAGVAFGNYTISAYAGPVSGETSISDNNFTGGWVVVAGVGDLTGGTPNALDFVPDKKVDITDVAITAKFFGQKAPPAPANCDVSGTTVGVPDGKIDITDVATVAKRFGQHYP